MERVSGLIIFSRLFYCCYHNDELIWFYKALKVWNITSQKLASQNVPIENVCRGQNWGKNGYLTKPILYLDYVDRILSKSSNPSSVYVILMDSDTFWAVTDLQTIWRKYDCVRGKKDIILSTEMSCWVGRYCTEEDLVRWYNKSQIYPSFSPFANSGVLMGSAIKIKKLLEYVVLNNQSYYITYFKRKFDDQYAIADYAINIAPEEVALDYHQQLLASFAIHAPADPPDTGWPFVCKNREGKWDKSCVVWTDLLNRQGHFSLNSSTCELGRYYWPNMPLQIELETLATDPIIWHGNGVGKNMFKRFGHSAYLCLLKNKYNMTEDEYVSKYGYG